MKRLCILVLMLGVFGCGEEEKDWVDIPAIITYIDAGVDAKPDAKPDVEISMDLDNCYEERVEIAGEAEKCTDDLMEFWKYMTYIDDIPCNKIRLKDYPSLC